MKKTIKKPKKPVIKKVAIKKSAPIKKAQSKKSLSKKKNINKNKKIFGFSVIFCGVLGLVLVTLYTVPKLISSGPSNSSVLGANTAVPTPTGLKATVKDLKVTLSWNDMKTNADSYRVWTYNATQKKYLVLSVVNSVNQTSPTTISFLTQQWLGTTGYYKISALLNNIESEASSAVKVVMPNIAKPEVKTAISSSKGIKVTWKAINGVDSYTLWRKTGILGGKSKIATLKRPMVFSEGVYNQSIYKSPLNSFLDTSVSKSKLYSYYITASKEVCVNECKVYNSTYSLAKAIWNSQKVSAVGNFSLSSRSASTLSFDGTMDSNLVYTVKISCSSCAEQSYTLTYPTPTKVSFSSPWLQDIGKNSHGHTEFLVTGLKLDTKYSLTFSAWYEVWANGGTTPLNGDMYEIVLGSARSATTQDMVTAPSIPTGFKYDGILVNIDYKSAILKWNIPINSPADGYKFSIDCVSIGGNINWTNELPLGDINLVSKLETNTKIYEFNVADLPVGIPCTAHIWSYNLSDGIKLYSSNSADITFTQNL